MPFLRSFGARVSGGRRKQRLRIVLRLVVRAGPDGVLAFFQPALQFSHFVAHPVHGQVVHRQLVGLQMAGRVALHQRVVERDARVLPISPAKAPRRLLRTVRFIVRKIARPNKTASHRGGYPRYPLSGLYTAVNVRPAGET